MQLSKKCLYGAQAMLEIARHRSSGSIKRRQIAESQEISDSYLENILILLKNAGLILTERGARGGYSLARPPEEISFYDVFSILEGPMALVECLDTTQSCSRQMDCAIRPLWDRMNLALVTILKETSLADCLSFKKEIRYHI